ncbi:hypothetical protein Franean1_0512 [Parafrankia sp. EAN1pec]|uniref:alpha/beta hydrolase domain-containing protein n=1 Tax=Parafrankia sp. (strain EAN1pec) TaxID=298653 RepID=UPI0000542EB4|nr:hypothetical protein Franean1_0512 [Frankia sp. EAN1pec]
MRDTGPLATTRPRSEGPVAVLPTERLAELYPTRDDYLRRYAEAVDAAIAAGLALPADHESLLGFTRPVRVPQ